VLYISKPKLTCCGLALPLKFTANRPIVLNVDDWEVGLRSKGSFVLTYPGSLARLVRSDSLYWIREMEGFSELSDAVTFLYTVHHDRFGGRESRMREIQRPSTRTGSTGGRPEWNTESRQTTRSSCSPEGPVP
jgi:hypothetical protein